MSRLSDVAATVRRSVDALGAVGWLLLAATALFGAMSLYGWSRGLAESALNVGLLAVALFCVFLLLVVARGWVVPWLAGLFKDVSYER